MTENTPPTVQTMLPDDEFHALKAELQRNRNHRKYERFGGDTHSTKIWLTSDGRILSQMPPEDFIKEIIPTSMGFFSNQNASSGLAKSVCRFAELNGAPQHIAASILIKFYTKMEIPKSVELPDKILLKFKCVRVDTEGNEKTMSPDEVKENLF